MATAEKLLTAIEYARLPDLGKPTELVRGEIVEMNLPKPRHGQVCLNVIAELLPYCRGRKLGHLLSNDTGVLVEHDPDTVRGPDVAFYSYTRLAPGPLSREAYLQVPPDVAIEVLSTDDRPGRILRKIGEYLRAGVETVVVIDPEDSTVMVHERGREPIALGSDGTLTLTAIAPDCSIPVARFF